MSITATFVWTTFLCFLVAPEINRELGGVSIRGGFILGMPILAPSIMIAVISVGSTQHHFAASTNLP